MAVSRNALEYLSRRGLIKSSVPPRPRLDVTGLKVRVVPLEAPLPTQEVLGAYEGDPPPDRGSARPWPDQGVVANDQQE